MFSVSAIGKLATARAEQVFCRQPANLYSLFTDLPTVKGSRVKSEDMHCKQTDYAMLKNVLYGFNGAEEECRRQGIAFLPLVAETFGGWHSGAEREVKKLGAALARHTGQEEAEATSHLWGRLGILLQRGNAAILGNRVPALPGAYIDGIL